MDQRRGRGGARSVNAMLREAGALPQLVKHDRWDYHLHAHLTRGAAGRPDAGRGS